MNRNNMEHLAKEGNILARNQKVPSAREPCVSSLAISHHPPQLCDLDMAAAQTLDPNDGWGQKQWVERVAISAWRALWCEPRHPSITAALSFVAGAALSRWGYILQKPAAEENMPLLWSCKVGNIATDIFDGTLVEGGDQILNVCGEVCSCRCECTLSLRWCCRLSSIITASIITLSGRNEKFAFKHIIIIYYMRKL